MSPKVTPIDPATEGGRAAARALTDACIAVEQSIARRKRRAALVAADEAEQALQPAEAA